MPGRTVVVHHWDGPVVVHHLPDLGAIPSMNRKGLVETLRRLDVPIPFQADTEDLRDRLLAYPTADDEDKIATAHTPEGGGVRPVVRVLEVARFGRPHGVGHDTGTPGSAPGQRWLS